MNDYSNAKIYKVVCSETNRVYIGSTIKPLHRRLSQHKAPSNDCNTKDFINPTIHLIEDYCCNSKIELHKRERYHIENNDCVNKYIPSRNRKEGNRAYYLDNTEKYKQYRLNNIEKITNRKNEKFNCECGGKYSRSSKSRHLKSQKHKKYMENNI